MIDTLIVLSQFILLSLLYRDMDVEFVTGLLALNFLFQLIVLPFFNNYLILTGFDLVMLCSIVFLRNTFKKVILFTIVFCSLLMNVYEGMSYYQTIIYPYRNVIQWWMVEVMLFTLAWNCDWRINFEICRNYYNSRGRVDRTFK